MGTVIGPGTANLNAGLSKKFAINEHVRIKLEGSFTNVLNHLNLANPVLAIDNPSVGQIASARPADFGGNCSCHSPFTSSVQVWPSPQ